jgi:hypothetical protein
MKYKVRGLKINIEQSVTKVEIYNEQNVRQIGEFSR